MKVVLAVLLFVAVALAAQPNFESAPQANDPTNVQTFAPEHVAGVTDSKLWPGPGGSKDDFLVDNGGTLPPNNFGQYAGGACAGIDCCLLVSTCMIDLAANADNDDITIGAEWRQAGRCPFPICAHGYHYDTNGGNCVRYRDSAQAPLRHDVYRTLRGCLKDYARASATHCAGPLEAAWRKCKIGAGFD